jgi:hypothetical protein
MEQSIIFPDYQCYLETDELGSGLEHWCRDWTWKIGLLIDIASEDNDMDMLM